MTPVEENKDDKAPCQQIRMGMVQVSDGKSRPRAARLVLTMDAVTHYRAATPFLQKQDTDSSTGDDHPSLHNKPVDANCNEKQVEQTNGGWQTAWGEEESSRPGSAAGSVRSRPASVASDRVAQDQAKEWRDVVSVPLMMGYLGAGERIEYMGWVHEGVVSATQPWQTYRPKFLLLKGTDVMLFDQPPTMFRTVKESETVDWRQHCFLVQSSARRGAGRGGRGAWAAPAQDTSAPRRARTC
ncbi:hypothetical protein MSG28_011308 [Choristoneura fumiferana]|uniref:Uncharacterized protein n=1 Tax=Choristoneura fumiferana TaxID=7141 RepID=A0ACC0KR67_CHOFU|nr:hypothetical protein MSG28_011308 [Choristoneura fumiferana]